MKILYSKGYKCLLSQNQRVRNDFFGYRQYEGLAKYSQTFLRKTLRWKDTSARTIWRSGYEQSLNTDSEFNHEPELKVKISSICPAWK